MRRVYLRDRTNILNRYLIHVAALNLSPVMRNLIGVGTLRGLQAGLRALVAHAVSIWTALVHQLGPLLAETVRNRHLPAKP
jgi:transposase